METFQHEYLGLGTHPSKCKIHIKTIKNPRYGNTTYVCFEDLNCGTSVTNASEQLATEIILKHSLEPEKTRFFETYDRNAFDEISYSWKDLKAYSPKWFTPEFDIKHVFNLK